MNHPAAVRAVERIGDLGQNPVSLAPLEHALPLHLVAEGLPSHVGHHEVPEILDLAEAVERENARMREVGRCACLPPEALAMSLRHREIGAEHLDRDETLEIALSREIDRGHSALTERADDLVLPGQGCVEENSKRIVLLADFQGASFLCPDDTGLSKRRQRNREVLGGRAPPRDLTHRGRLERNNSGTEMQVICLNYR